MVSLSNYSHKMFLDLILHWPQNHASAGPGGEKFPVRQGIIMARRASNRFR